MLTGLRRSLVCFHCKLDIWHWNGGKDGFVISGCRPTANSGWRLVILSWCFNLGSWLHRPIGKETYRAIPHWAMALLLLILASVVLCDFSRSHSISLSFRPRHTFEFDLLFIFHHFFRLFQFLVHMLFISFHEFAYSEPRYLSRCHRLNLLHFLHKFSILGFNLFEIIGFNILVVQPRYFDYLFSIR
jgi:hypothetical protein